MDLIKVFGERNATPKILFQELLSVKNIESIHVSFLKVESLFSSDESTFVFTGKVVFKHDNTKLSQEFKGNSIFDVLGKVYEFLVKL